MKQSLTVTSYFDLTDDADGYRAGLCDHEGRGVGVEALLDAAIVEPVVLKKAQLAIGMAPDGVFSIHADGLSEEVLSLLRASGVLSTLSLTDAVRAALDPELLAPDDDAKQEIAVLCRELEQSLEMARSAAALVGHDQKKSS
ncbi:MAG: hypothetical protein NW215_07475 [Hyphomicrobiales bacterium]|nr:hypothetical protein [Hyphomicrobiales bacterium]